MSIDIAPHDVHPVAPALNRLTARQDIHHRFEKLSSKPLASRHRKAHLVGPHASAFGDSSLHRLAQDKLVPGSAKFPLIRKRICQLSETVIE